MDSRETEEKWHVNATCDSELDPFDVKEIIELIGQSGLGSKEKMEVMY